MNSIGRTALALLTAFTTSALAAPISLSCISEFEKDGEQKTETKYFYIDVENKEMLLSENKEKWRVLEDFKADKVSVTGTWFQRLLYHIYDK